MQLLWQRLPLKQSIKSEGVINLFSDVQQEFSLFDSKFLEEVSKMKEKNLAVELLKKLIAEQVQVYRRTNVVLPITHRLINHWRVCERGDAMIIYATKQTVERYKLKMPDEFSDPTMRTIVQAVVNIDRKKAAFVPLFLCSLKL